jgi:hypothetical protein
VIKEAESVCSLRSWAAPRATLAIIGTQFVS